MIQMNIIKLIKKSKFINLNQIQLLKIHMSDHVNN